MEYYAQKINLAEEKGVDRWVGIATVGPVLVNSQTPGDALTRVVMNFRLGNLTYTLDSADGEITISNASTWLCTVPARDSFLPRSGLWKWELEFHFGTASVWTLYVGEIRVWDDVA